MDSNLRIHLVTIFLFCGVAITGVHASCLIDPPSQVPIKETDPPGHVIFSQNGSLTTKWEVIIYLPAEIKDHLGAYFSMENNETTVTFRINKTLDLEAIHEKWDVELAAVGINLDCRENGSLEGGRRQMFVTVAPVNEFDPEFINTPLIRNVSEDTPISSSVIKLLDHAQDRDINPGQNEITKFQILKYYNPELDGSSHFGMPNSQEGLVDVDQTLDYESMPENIKYYNLNVSVEDYGGRMALTTVRIDILDADDQDPEFFIPGCDRDCYISYTAYITELFMGLIEEVQPSQIRARDRDKSISNSVAYSIKGSNPAGYETYFYQDITTGEVNVTKLFNETEKSLTEITLFLEAKEISVQGRVASTTLLIHIEGRAPTTTTIVHTTVASRVQAAGADDTLLIVLVVLAVVAFILAATFIIAVVVFKKKFKNKSPLVGPDDSPTPSENQTDVEELSVDTQWPANKSDQFNGMPTTGRGQDLPPLKDMGTGTEEQKKMRRSRRRKKERETEEFDGTQDYEGSAEPSFYEQRKSRVKQSSRSKQQMDPKYWITVDNDYPDETAS